jgi:hypothetical protein
MNRPMLGNRAGSSKSATSNQTLLSEHDIIVMHTKFVTNGFHTIAVPSLEQGRMLLQNFFNSLNYYHERGCVTLEQSLFDPTIAHIYHELFYGGYLEPSQGDADDADMDEFFIERFYFDFVWIEGQPQLLTSDWFDCFKKKIKKFSLEKNIPIILFIYELQS